MRNAIISIQQRQLHSSYTRRHAAACNLFFMCSFKLGSDLHRVASTKLLCTNGASITSPQKQYEMKRWVNFPLPVHTAYCCERWTWIISQDAWQATTCAFCYCFSHRVAESCECIGQWIIQINEFPSSNSSLCVIQRDTHTEIPWNGHVTFPLPHALTRTRTNNEIFGKFIWLCVSLRLRDRRSKYFAMNFSCIYQHTKRGTQWKGTFRTRYRSVGVPTRMWRDAGGRVCGHRVRSLHVSLALLNFKNPVAAHNPVE